MKLNTIKMVVPPLSEMEDAQLEDILAGWKCFSFAPTHICLTYGCTILQDGKTCNGDQNYCVKYFKDGQCVEAYE